MATKKAVAHTFNWLSIFAIFMPIVTVIGFIATWAVFYSSTKDTLSRHDEQFKSIASQFKEVGNIFERGQKETKEESAKNFAAWMSENKREQEKADKVRDQLSTAITTLSTSSVAAKVQLDSAIRTLDSLQSKIDNITSVQQENRAIFRQQGKAR